MTVNITGSFRDQVQENGDIQSVLRGRNLIFGPGIEGILLTIGRATATFTLPTQQEPDGTATITSGPQGRLVNLCDELAE